MININEIEILNKVILISIRNKDSYFIKDILKEKVLLHPYYSYSDILDELIEMFNPLTNEHNREKINIISIWKLMYPYIKQYMTHPYENYHFYNDRLK